MDAERRTGKMSIGDLANDTEPAQLTDENGLPIITPIALMNFSCQLAEQEAKEAIDQFRSLLERALENEPASLLGIRQHLKEEFRDEPEVLSRLLVTVDQVLSRIPFDVDSYNLTGQLRGITMATSQTKSKSSDAAQCTITGHVIVGLDDEAMPIHEERTFQFDDTWASPEPEITNGGTGDRLTLVVASTQEGKIFAVFGSPKHAADRFWVATLDGKTIVEVNGLKDMNYSLTWENCRVAPPIVITTFMSWRNG